MFKKGHSEPPKKHEAPHKPSMSGLIHGSGASGWEYQGEEFDTGSQTYVHRWTIADPTGASHLFRITVSKKGLTAAEAIEEAKARLVS